ncbi:MAG: TIM barrel protein [SAR202 cluster bacterium]|nr:TIM barrel protein [SAR202 cluster bacterium]
MPKLNANIQFLFNEHDVLSRFEEASNFGFNAVELQSPYKFDPAYIKNILDDFNLKMILINVPVMDEDTGKMNLAILPEKTDLFKQRIEKTLEYAEKLDVNVVNCTPGPSNENLNFSEMYETLISNLEFASPLFESIGVKLLIEPINTIDQPRFFINKSDQALKLISDVNHKNLGLQYDLYHMQIMEGNLTRTIENNIEKIWHFQIADNPGRNEPGSGEINFNHMFSIIDKLNYQGFIGAEYHPKTTTLEGLSWIKKYPSIKI